MGQQQGGPSGPARPGVAGPGRVENMRVPNRPRNEMSLAGNTSEAAANVFASMLGVASTAPQYPGQPANAPQMQGGQYGSPQNPPMAPSPTASPMGTNSGIYGQGPVGTGSGIYGQGPVNPMGTNSGIYGQGSVNPMGTGSSGYSAQIGYQNSGYQGNIPAGYSSAASQGSGSFGNPPPANYAMGGSSGYAGGAQGANPGFSGTSEDQRAAKPAKRSFFEALRDLFFRSN